MENNNVETVLEIINELYYYYYYSRVDAVLSSDKIKERYLGKIMTSLQELLDNNLEGFNSLQLAVFYTLRENFTSYYTNLEAFQLNAKADANEFYTIIENLASECEVLITGIQFWSQDPLPTKTYYNPSWI
jgi:hypothetical protein